MAEVMMFAALREASGHARLNIDGNTVGEVIEHAKTRFGEDFARLLPFCSTYVDGDPAGLDTNVGANNELALLPPVSGG